MSGRPPHEDVRMFQIFPLDLYFARSRPSSRHFNRRQLCLPSISAESRRSAFEGLHPNAISKFVATASVVGVDHGPLIATDGETTRHAWWGAKVATGTSGVTIKSTLFLFGDTVLALARSQSRAAFSTLQMLFLSLRISPSNSLPLCATSLGLASPRMRSLVRQI